MPSPLDRERDAGGAAVFHPANVLMTANDPLVSDWMRAKSGSHWADVACTSLILTISAKSTSAWFPALTRLIIRLFHQAYLNRYLAYNPGPQGKLQQWLPVIFATRLNEQTEPEREALIQMVRSTCSVKLSSIRYFRLKLPEQK